MTPEWIFFDVGWTLVDETRAHILRLEQVLAAAARPGGFTARSLYGRYEIAVLEGAPDPFVKVLEEVGLPPTDRDRFGFDHGATSPYRDAAPALRALKGIVKLGIVANQSPGLPGRLELMGLGGFFDVILGSGDCGCRKPGPEIFALAAGKAGCPAGMIMMVGDRLDNDIAPAKRAGWRTAWVRRGGHVKAEPRNAEETPDVVVAGLLELAGMFVPVDRGPQA